ncbi:MAG: O-antigen ligase family protein, partial [Dehalococcoidia bacterium]
MVIIRIGLVILLWMPLVVTTSTIYPFTVGKAVFARVIIEVLAAVWLVLVLYNPAFRPPRSRILALFGLYLVIAFVAAAQGVSFTHSVWSDYSRMLGLWDLFHWFLMVVVAASVLRSSAEWVSLFNWNLGVTFVVSVLALSQAYGAPLLPFLSGACRLDSTLGNPSYLATILVITTLIAVGLLAQSWLPLEDGAGRHEDRTPRREVRLQRRNIRWWRVFWLATAALGLWVLFQTGARGALVGLIAGTLSMPLALGIWGNRRALRPVSYAAGAILIALTGLFLLDQTLGFPVAAQCRKQTVSTRLVQTTLEESSVSTRLEAANIGFRAFQERPILGWGPDNYGLVYERFSGPEAYNFGIIQFANAHNKIFDDLATSGAIGTVAYLAIWMAVGWSIVRRRRPSGEEALAYAILGALVTYFVQNLFLFDTSAMLLQWSLLVAWAAGHERQDEGREQAGRTNIGKKLTDVVTSRLGSLVVFACREPRVKLTMTIAITVVLGLSLYSFNFLPFRAATIFGDLYYNPHTPSEQIVLAQKSFDTFPYMANFSRGLFFWQLIEGWGNLSQEDRSL